MAGFVDCTKYNKEQQEQDTRIDNLEKREIVHDESLKGGGISEKSPLGLNKSEEKDNAIKVDEKGVYVKDLEPQVEKLEEALKNKYDRLGNDLEARIRELNGRLNALKDIEVALAAAKAEGNYNKIKELEARLQAAKEAQQTGDKGLAEAIEALRKQGLTDEQIRKIIDDAVAKAGGTGRYITRIETNQNDGTVTYYYSDGTSATGKLANFGGVVADQRTIVGNGHDQALKVQLSKQAGNQLIELPDGLYYGSSRSQHLYVDVVNGSDENVGTRDKPLRTVRKAIERIEIKDGYVSIHLKEKQEHVFEYPYAFALWNNTTFVAYGPRYDEIVAEYTKQSPTQGPWIPETTKEAAENMPTLVFKATGTAQYRNKIGSSTTAFKVLNHKVVNIKGLKIKSDQPAGPNPNSQWRSLFYGDGTLELDASIIDNSNSGLLWDLFSDHDGSLMAKLYFVTLTVEPTVDGGVENSIAHVGMSLTVHADDNVNEYAANGTTVRKTTPTEALIKAIYGKGGKSVYIGNFHTNVKLS